MSPNRDRKISPGNDYMYGGAGDDFINSVGDGDGYDTVKKGSDQNLDRFVGCEKFVG